MKKIYLIFAIVLILFPNITFGQLDYSLKDSIELYKVKPRMGGYIHYGYNMHFTDFTGIPGIPSCCPEYTFGIAPGLSFGGLYEMQIKNNYWLGIRLGYSNIDGEFEAAEYKQVIINGEPQQAEFTHYLKSTFQMIDLRPMLTYKIKHNVNLYAGFNLGMIWQGTYGQYEELTSDEGAYKDGSNRINPKSGDILDLSAFQTGMTVGAGWEFPMNKNHSLLISPEIFYTFNITSPIKDVKWYSSYIRGGMSLKYKEPPPPPPLPDPPLSPGLPFLSMPEELPDCAVNIEAHTIDSTGTIHKDINVRIEDFTSSNMRPLLNYVFFDSVSYTLPNRYHLLKKSETHIFGNDKLKALNALQTYYHVLNIYGQRLRDNVNTKITLIGTNSNSGGEKKNKILSRKRAEEVKNYFVTIWGIDEKRIKTKAVNLPKKNSTDKETPENAHQENRRVEIIVSDAVLNEPVITNDTKRIISTSKIQFTPQVVSSIGVKNWKFEAVQNKKVLIDKFGYGKVPTEITWDFVNQESSDIIPTTSGKVTYFMEIEDSLGRICTSQIYQLPIKQITIDKKRSQNIEDTSFEYYSLILFDFGKSTLKGEHRKVVDFIKSRILENSKVTVKGYTDIMGDEDDNMRLANKRAKSVGKSLKIPVSQIIGVGESPALYDNVFPESRFYCRTVQIEIETVRNGK